LHTAYSFYLLRQRAMIPAVVEEAMAGWADARGWPAWSLSNHDVVRFPTRLAGDDPQRTKLMLALLMSLRGTAFLYQGEELGLPHGDVPYERLRDPESIAFWPAGIGRDGARTPMPWSSTAPMAGFTSASDAWLPLDPRHRAMAVDVQETHADSVLAFTRAVIALRRGSAALREGEFTSIPAPSPVLAFERTTEDERVVCIYNLGGAPALAPLPVGRVMLVIGRVEQKNGEVALGGYSGLLVAI
jgi:alpha-glucosidase